jgi:putative NIF3 family GTP cyclohydrolase 1 type 2
MALKLQDFNDILHKAVPFKDTWIKEAYGPHNTKLNPKRTVERALYCVTPTPGVVKQFKEGGYDILLSHHPYIVGVPQWIAHTALDCTKGGLNDQWRDLFNLKNTKHFDGNLGWYGELERPHSLQELIEKSEGFVGAPLIGEHHGHEHPINSIVICTGLGGMVEREAHKTGADCYVLGEASQHFKRSPFKARIETGHTLSEHGTGLAFFRKHLEPHGIIVDPSSLEHDKYSGEVYRQPVYHSFYSETGLPKPSMGTRGVRQADDWGIPDNHLWDEEDADFHPIDDDSYLDDPKFWEAKLSEKPKPSDKPPIVQPNTTYIPKRDTTSRGTGMQGFNIDEKPKKIEKPAMPPGGDFPDS